MMLEAAIAQGVENHYNYKFGVRSSEFGVNDNAVPAVPAVTPHSIHTDARMGDLRSPNSSAVSAFTPNSELRTPNSFQIDLRPMVQELVADLSAGFAVGVVAARFHNTVVQFLFEAALQRVSLRACRLSPCRAGASPIDTSGSG